MAWVETCRSFVVANLIAPLDSHLDWISITEHQTTLVVVILSTLASSLPAILCFRRFRSAGVRLCPEAPRAPPTPTAIVNTTVESPSQKSSNEEHSGQRSAAADNKRERQAIKSKIKHVAKEYPEFYHTITIAIDRLLEGQLPYHEKLLFGLQNNHWLFPVLVDQGQGRRLLEQITTGLKLAICPTITEDIIAGLRSALRAEVRREDLRPEFFKSMQEIWDARVEEYLA